jgi:hypothetical protein
MMNVSKHEEWQGERTVTNSAVTSCRTEWMIETFLMVREVNIQSHSRDHGSSQRFGDSGSKDLHTTVAICVTSVDKFRMTGG